MSYISKVIVPGERVLHEGRFHWWDKVKVLVIFVVGFFASPFLLIHLGISVLYTWLLFFSIGLAAILQMWSTDMVVTNRRLLYKRGLIARKAEEMKLSRIEEVNFRQGIFGRFLNYGKVRVYGTGGSIIKLPRMAEPLRFKKELDSAHGQDN